MSVDADILREFLKAERTKTIALTEQLEAERKKYYELIFAVAKKFEGETRHETALRYIRRSDESGSIQSKQT